MMSLQLVEALVVERCHQLGFNGLSLRIVHGECPLLLLTRLQTIAEGGPLQLQFLIGQRAPDAGAMGIALALLHPGIGEQEPVLVFILISKLAVNQLVAAFNSTTLNHLFTGKDAIDDVHIRRRRTDLDSHRLTIVRELTGRLIEPVVGGSGRGGIAEREHHEVTLEGISLTGSLQRMLTTLEFLTDGYRLLGLDGLPLAVVETIAHIGIKVLSCCIQQVEHGLRLFIAQHFLWQIHAQSLLAVAKRQGEFTMMGFSGSIRHIG